MEGEAPLLLSSSPALDEGSCAAGWLDPSLLCFHPCFLTPLLSDAPLPVISFFSLSPVLPCDSTRFLFSVKEIWFTDLG